MLLQLLIICFAFVCNLFLGLITLRNNPKSVTHRLLALITLLISSWIIANYLSTIGYNRDFTLFWIRMVMVITSFFAPLIYLFLSSFPSAKFSISDNKLALIIFISFIVAFISLTPLTFSDVSLVNGIHPQAGPGLLLYGLFTLLFLLAGFRQIYIKYKHSSGLYRLQIKYLIFGFFATFGILFFTNFIFVVLLNQTNFVVFGPIFTLIFVSLITYSIIKHRLLDIRFILARTVSYSLLSFIIIAFYTSFLYLFSHFIILSTIDNSQIVASIGLSLIIAYTFQPIKKYLEKKTDKLFFQDVYYSPEEILGSISYILATTLELQELTKQVFRKLSSVLHLDTIGLLLKNNQFNNLAIPTATAQSFQNISSSMVVFDNLEEGSLKEDMRQISLSVIIKLEVKNKPIGLLLIGNKLSGDYFGDYDLKILEIIGPQLAIAIQNSQRYEEIRKFNITLKKEVSQATSSLRQANSKLKELDVLKDEFVSVASHELRTPMTAIKSYLWMALSGQGGPLNDKQKFYLQRSYDSTDRLIKMVNDMLNISRIESGRMSLELSRVSLPKLVDEIVAEFTPRLEELSIHLKVDTASPPPDVIADGDKIREVLINLIGNSLKFTPKEGTISVNFLVKDNQVVTQITDTGSGLTPEMIKTLFQKFGLIKGSYQTNRQSTPGTGLGLYICQQIIKLHTGLIWAESPGIDQGSTFCFSLPVYSGVHFKHLQKTIQHTSNVGIIHSKI